MAPKNFRYNLPYRFCRRGKILYTEDKLPVTNIFVKITAGKCNSAVLQKYFRRFGAVTDVQLKSGKRKTSKEFIVSFLKATVALRVLERKRHTLKNVRIELYPCPSWQQPFSMQHRSANSQLDTFPIHNLDVHAICAIFENLDLRCQLQFSLCHPIFERAFHKFICPSINVINLIIIHKYTNWQIKQLCSKAGRYVTFLIIDQKCHFSSEDIGLKELFAIKLVGAKLKNVKKIGVVDNWGSASKLFEYLNVDNISCLQLFNCKLLDNDITSLHHLKNLETLDLAFNENLTGVTMKNKFKNLKRLGLCGIKDFKTKCLRDFCQTSNLMHLDISGTQVDINYLLPYVQNLELLNANQQYYLSSFKLTKLKEFFMYNNYFPYAYIDSSLFEMIESDNLTIIKLLSVHIENTIVDCLCSFKNVRSLFMNNCNFLLEGSDLVIIARNMRKLEVLNLQNSYGIHESSVLPLFQFNWNLKHLILRFCVRFEEIKVENFVSAVKYRQKLMAAKNLIAEPLDVYFNHENYANTTFPHDNEDLLHINFKIYPCYINDSIEDNSLTNLEDILLDMMDDDDGAQGFI